MNCDYLNFLQLNNFKLKKSPLEVQQMEREVLPWVFVVSFMSFVFVFGKMSWTQMELWNVFFELRIISTRVLTLANYFSAYDR